MASVALNELEMALLSAFAEQVPELAPCIGRLAAKQREFSGVGTFTAFEPTGARAAIPDGPIGFQGVVELPNLPHDLGASVSIVSGEIEFLEIVSFNGDWDGTQDGFSIRRA